MRGAAWLVALLAGLLTGLVLSSCATLASPGLLAPPAPTVVVEYPAAHVRIYTVGRRCRVEVITPTATIQTGLTHCTTIPHAPARGTP